MSQSVPPKTNFPTIPNFREFGNALYDRIYVKLKLHRTLRYEFMIFLNLINRAEEKDIKEEVIIYAGVDRGRKFLQAEQDGLDEVWQELKSSKILQSQTKETRELFAEADREDLDINDFIEIRKLEDYFELGELNDPAKNLELPILSKHFDLRTTRYVTVPGYSFAQLQGSATFIFTEEDYNELTPEVLRDIEELIPGILTTAKELTPEVIDKVKQLDHEVINRIKELSPDTLGKIKNSDPQKLARETSLKLQVIAEIKALSSEVIAIVKKLSQQVLNKIKALSPEILEKIKFHTPDALEKRSEFLKNLCRIFLEEYDDLILNWDLDTSSGSHYRVSRVSFETLSQPEYYEVIDKNPILKVIDCREYYELSLDYLKNRIRQNNEIPKLLLREHRRRAIIAILIDSYAHNISAHSLTVLKWWFQQRGAQFDAEEIIRKINGKLAFSDWGVAVVNFLEAHFPDLYDRQDLEMGVQTTLARWYNQLSLQKNNPDPIQLPVRDQLFPLAKEMAPLFRFLLEKGAFWSGVTRDQQFGGEITNFFDILWEDFINNPLYLGTIAYSERITRLNLHIRIYEEFNHAKGDDQNDLKRTYRIKSIMHEGERVFLDGKLASIDVGAPIGTPRSLQHEFVKYGDHYAFLKAELESMEVFFPGGVIGKHAFFTILENEIRNVKHFTTDEHQKMREEGLTLTIAIHPTGLNEELSYPKVALYKVGVWLNHLTKMSGKGEDHLLIKRLFNLRDDIITKETYRAKLGGNYQDKICAAMLFNNTFISVQNGDDYGKRHEDEKSGRILRDRLYYPWIRAALSTGPEASDRSTEHDVEVRMRHVDEGIAKKALENRPENEMAFFKKYFHLWQGAFQLRVSEAAHLELENVARFRIVHIRQDEALYREIRSKGVIRILQSNEGDLSDLEAYRQWLLIWLGADTALRFVFCRHGQQVSHLIFDQDGARYLSKEAYGRLPVAEREEYTYYHQYELHMAHSERAYEEQTLKTNLIGIRSHGIMAQKFLDHLPSIKDFATASLHAPLLAYELTEVLATRLCIFDKRIIDRVPDAAHRQLLGKYLHCEIYGEEIEDWRRLQRKGLHNYHFIIMHLSFIESMTNDENRQYREKYMVQFIKDQVKDAREQIGTSFLFIITTGRGRNQWWEEISKSEFTDFVSFRPVESLIEAVENARMKRDDIELKYNLVKVLLGS